MFRIVEAIYLAASTVLGAILIFHIFKVRYLDYYDVTKEEKLEMDEERKTEQPTTCKDSKITLENKKERIIIRDPKHSSYKFISGLLKILLFIIKIFAIFIGGFFCFSLIGLILFIILSFLFIKTGILFIGVLLILVGSSVINIIILKILYDFIFIQKGKKSILGLTFLASIIIIGCGLGLALIGTTKLSIINDGNHSSFVNEEFQVEMNENLFFDNHYYYIQYIESDNSDVKIITTHSKYYKTIMDKKNTGYEFYWTSVSSNEMDKVNDYIKDINNREIVDYSVQKIVIYTSKENINILKNNLEKYRQIQKEMEYQERIKNYQEKIDDLERQKEEQEEKIASLEELLKERDFEKNNNQDE